mmetsp:Transcript_10748/g.29644  ORF Transcript_10748/g.29644 Transcript_10748/m.29644 type:complete len:324 (-) Transcript_10748:259-1230(-)
MVVLQKVIRRPSSHRIVRLAPSRGRIELEQIHLPQIFLHFQNGRLIAATVTVIGSGKYRHEFLIVIPLVAFHHELMGAGNQTQAVAFVELGRNVGAKGKAGAAGGNAPPFEIVRIAPEQVANGSLVRHFLHAIELSHVINGIEGRRQSGVGTVNGIFHQRRNGQVIKQVGKEFPNVGVAVFANALVVKAVDLRDLSTFVIAANQKDAVGVPYFVTDQHGDGFDAVITAIDIVPQKEVIGIGNFPANGKDFHQIVPLSMNISHNGHGCRHGLDIGFAEQHFAGQRAKVLDFGIGQRSSIVQFAQPNVEIVINLAAFGRGWIVEH